MSQRRASGGVMARRSWRAFRTVRRVVWRMAPWPLHHAAALRGPPPHALRAQGGEAASVHPGLGLDVLDLVGEGVFVDRAVVDAHRPAGAAPAVEPGDG